MGFLDFLKKNKPAKENTVVPPPPIDSVSGNLSSKAQEELFAPPSHLSPPIDPFIEKDAVEHAKPEEWSVRTESQKTSGNNSPPSPPSYDQPQISDDTEPESNPGMYEDVPLPPEDMQDPSFMEATSDDMPAPFPEESTGEDPFAPKKPVNEQPRAVKPKVSGIDLPDFTDDDFADFDDSEKSDEEEPEVIQEMPVKQEIDSGNIAPPPEHLPDLPEAEPEEEDDVPPFDVPPQFGKLEPAKFLSSNAYFGVDNAIRSSRKSMREADNAILDALSYHEHGDEKLRNFAITVNEIQELLMDLDVALFED